MLKVLIVDDDPSYQESYRSLVERYGYTSQVAQTRAAALEASRRESFDVVLLDKRLQGQGGPDDGIDLLAEARFTGAKVILITGYADEASIRRAFELGAYDYLEKGNLTPTLLAVKLDRVRELVQLRQTPDARERVLQELWRNLSEGSPHARGRRLEELVIRLMTAVPGFVEASRNLRTETEELDVVIRNESADPLWRKLPAYLLAEAKNWSRPVGTAEIGWFAAKAILRPDAMTGFLFAPAGFTTPVMAEVRLLRQKQVQIVPVDAAAMAELVAAADRGAVLKRLHAEAAVG